MRRLALILASLAALLFVVPAASAAEAPSRGANLELHEDGFLVSVRGEVSEEKVVLTLDRHGEVASYEVPAKFTDDTVKARFGQLGELDYTFTPLGPVGQCSEFADGTFEGTFTFAGENEYVGFQADRAPGSFLMPARQGCRKARGARSGAERRAEREASLAAHTRLPLPARSLLVFELEDKGRQKAFFSAFQEEKAEGMLIARGAQVSALRRDFTWNLKAGTAHVHPPAPFTGSATFKRRRDGWPVWRGSLRAPMLGGQPFRLTGTDFRAQLLKGSLLD